MFLLFEDTLLLYRKSRRHSNMFCHRFLKGLEFQGYQQQACRPSGGRWKSKTESSEVELRTIKWEVLWLISNNDAPIKKKKKLNNYKAVNEMNTLKDSSGEHTTTALTKLIVSPVNLMKGFGWGVLERYCSHQRSIEKSVLNHVPSN